MWQIIIIVQKKWKYCKISKIIINKKSVPNISHNEVCHLDISMCIRSDVRNDRVKQDSETHGFRHTNNASFFETAQFTREWMVTCDVFAHDSE